MKNQHCIFEEKIAEAGRTGQWTDALLAHVADCLSCGEIALVVGYLHESSSASRAIGGLPQAGFIWRKAQMAERAAALERALRPIVWARRFAFAACAVFMFSVVALNWSSLGVFAKLFSQSLLGHVHASSASSDSLLFLTGTFLLLIVLPVLGGLYSAWSEN